MRNRSMTITLMRKSELEAPTQEFLKLLSYFEVKTCQLGTKSKCIMVSLIVSASSASLIVKEIVSEAKDNKQLYFLGFLVAKKVFYKVWHGSLLRNLYLSGIKGNLWMLTGELYSHKKSRMKAKKTHSHTYNEQRGVRQREVFSTSCYNVLIDTLP